MPTWNELNIFTWEELTYFTWEDAGLDTLRLAQKYTDRSLNLPQSLKDKILKLCREQFDGYAKILGIKIEKPSHLSKIADLLGIISFLQSLLEIPAVSNAVQFLFDLLVALLNNQLLQILGK